MARPTLDRNVKFKALVKRLNLPRPFVRGLLETMWDVAAECGNPIIGSAEDVELAAEWPGEAGQWFESLKSGRWIDALPDGRWLIHDYWDHAPSYVKDRKRKEDSRKNNDLGQIRPGQSGISPNFSGTPAPAPAPIENKARGKPRIRDPEDLVPAKGFDRFWAEWPSHHRKRGRSKCLRLWRRYRLEDIADSVLAALRRDKVSRQWAERDGQFIPGPEPWLNDTPWETDPAEIVSPASAPEDDPMAGQRTEVTDDVLEAAGLPPRNAKGHAA